MLKYATYDYYKNKNTGEIKKVFYIEDSEGSKDMEKLAAEREWIIITDIKEIEKIESPKQ